MGFNSGFKVLKSVLWGRGKHKEIGWLYNACVNWKGKLRTAKEERR